MLFRSPATWRANRPARPKVTATVGGRAPSGLGTNALLDFNLEVTLDGETFALRADNSRQVAAAVAELRKRAEAGPEKSPSQVLEERFEDLIRRVINTATALDSVEKKVIVELLSRLNQSVQACDVKLLGYHFVG